MIPPLPSPLPRVDRALLRLIRLLVPPAERDEWTRSWAAELWCCHHARHAVRTRTLLPGVVHDALWLRSEQLREAAAGTAALCLSTLLLVVGIAALPALAPTGHWHGLGLWFTCQGAQFTCESLLIVFVSYATTPFPLESGSTRHHAWFKARLFHCAKNLLVLVAAFELASDLAFPLRALMPLTAAYTQSMSFALLALLGLRWSLADDAARCRQCLRTLAAPERVGRPSHNFLEWNGTELLCSHGHGLLSVPELETSWCRASAWVARTTSLSASTHIRH